MYLKGSIVSKEIMLVKEEDPIKARVDNPEMVSLTKDVTFKV